MASRSLLDLAPVVRRMALALQQEAAACGWPVLIFCTLRSNEEQAQLYASGRTRPGPILTHSRPGESEHNPSKSGYSYAFDAVPVRDGVPLWDDDAAIEQMGVMGEACGLEWSGRWRGSMRERVHFQLKRPASERVPVEGGNHA